MQRGRTLATRKDTPASSRVIHAFYTILSLFLDVTAYKFVSSDKEWASSRNLRCTGDENSLFECPNDTNTGDCNHSEDAGVRCIAGGELLCMES